MNNGYICPVCGFDMLNEAPYDENNYPSHEICSCCGFEFGFDDSSNHLTFDAYREMWIDKGFIYFTKEMQPPDWGRNKMQEQIKNIARVSYKPRI